MTDFRPVQGFEDVWRPAVTPRARKPQTVLGLRMAAASGDVRGRLARLAARAPEVLVKVTGRTRDPGHLTAHLDYISRNGDLVLEDGEGCEIGGRAAVRELADDWSALALADPRRRATTPFSVSVVLSMPPGTDAGVVRDSARAFAQEIFGDRFDYVFALHTDAPQPHVHLSVRALGNNGERLNPKKPDLELWRQIFAQALRDRGVAAEATPRRARGVTRKAERAPARKIRERHERGEGAPARVRRAAYKDAAKAAFAPTPDLRPWEGRLLERQRAIRAIYLAQAKLLLRSPDAADQVLGAKVAAFVSAMPQPDSQRLALARELRAANIAARAPSKDHARGG